MTICLTDMKMTDRVVVQTKEFNDVTVGEVRVYDTMPQTQSAHGRWECDLCGHINRGVPDEGHWLVSTCKECENRSHVL